MWIHCAEEHFRLKQSSKPKSVRWVRPVWVSASLLPELSRKHVVPFPHDLFSSHNLGPLRGANNGGLKPGRPLGKNSKNLYPQQFCKYYSIQHPRPPGDRPSLPSRPFESWLMAAKNKPFLKSQIRRKLLFVSNQAIKARQKIHKSTCEI